MATDFACSQFDAGRRCVEQWMSQYEMAAAPAVVVAERPAGVIAPPPPAAPRAAAAPLPTAVTAPTAAPAPVPVTPPPPPINPDTPFVRETLTAYRDLIDQNQVRELPRVEVPVRRARSVSPPRRTDTHICEARDWAVDTVVHYTPDSIQAGVRKVGDGLDWVGENYPTLSHVVHTGLEALHYVPELAGTGTRRGLRAIGVPQGIAQDAGDIISFAGDLIIPAAAVKGVRYARVLRTVRQVEAPLLWSSWRHYPKEVIAGREYAKIGERLYTHHAVDMMQPKSLGAPAGSIKHGRTFPASMVEHVIQNGEQHVVIRDGKQRILHCLDHAEVVTENNGQIVITVNPRKDL